MRRLLIMVTVVGLVFALAAPSYADFRVGIKGGVHLGNASIDPKPSPAPKLRAGTIHGAYGEILPMGGGLLGARVEVLWVDKGWAQDVTVLGNTYTQKASIKELALDPFILLNFGDAQFGTSPFIEVGPDIGFSINNIARTNTDPATFSENKDWKSVDFGLNFGAGVSFRAGMGKFVVDARYNLGLTNMNGAAAPNDATVKPSGIQVLVGYDFSVFPEYRRQTPGMGRF